MLKQLNDRIGENAAQNIKSGFEKCGIYPLNREKVLEKLPAEEPENVNDGAVEESLDDSFMSLLKEMRYGPENMPSRKRKKKVTVEPGKSVSGADFDSADGDDSEGIPQDADDNNDTDSAGEDMETNSDGNGGDTDAGDYCVDTNNNRSSTTAPASSANIFERFGFTS